MNPPPVSISFDCLPLRSIGRLDAPLDASPKFEALVDRVKQAVEEHGAHNTYYLYNGKCVYQLTNDAAAGMLQFRFEGTLLTDPDDRKTLSANLKVELRRETCDWLTEPIVNWFHETVSQALVVEFDRYIDAGDLQKTVARLEQVQAESDAHGGFVGMGL